MNSICSRCDYTLSLCGSDKMICEMRGVPGSYADDLDSLFKNTEGSERGTLEGIADE